ncbi:MAG: DUF393 domain-containing protein [Acidimicrobiales bacterium]|nr:DUF393 domain-containing protein [Acidimicrobiales bacterium]
MLVFDGDCGFCTSSARWIERRLPADARVEPWQSLDLSEIGLTEDDVQMAAYWVGDDGRVHRGHRGIGRSLIAAGGAWKVVGWALILPPISWFARLGYYVVAKYRYKLPGATDACRLPT